MVKEYRISPFAGGIDQVEFLGASVFESGNSVMLFEKTGHIILCDRAVAKALEQKKIPDGMRHILLQRNFARFPGWNVRFAEGKMRTGPEFFMVDLTDRCCMACSYCLRNLDGTGGAGKVPKRILYDICDYITEYCNEEKLPHITVQPWGGEPMLAYDSFSELRQRIRPGHTKVHYTMETNGILLTKERVEDLYQNKIGISISMDGTKETHERQRVFSDGSGTFEKVLQGLEQTEKVYGKQFGNITTLTKNSCNKVEEILDYYARDLGLLHVKFNFVHRSSFADCEDICLSEEKIAETELRILSKLTSLHEEGFRLIEENILTKLRNLLFGNASDICLSQGCNGGRKMIVFGMDGRIYPCELTDYPEKSIGSIYDGVPLVRLVEQAIKERDFFREKKDDACDRCHWFHYCQGGCTMHCISAGEAPGTIDRAECAANRALYPALVELILERSDIINHFLGYKAVGSRPRF